MKYCICNCCGKSFVMRDKKGRLVKHERDQISYCSMSCFLGLGKETTNAAQS